MTERVSNERLVENGYHRLKVPINTAITEVHS